MTTYEPVVAKPVLLRIVAPAGPDPSPDQRFARLAGHYVVGGIDQPDGRFEYQATPHRHEARQFPSFEAALTYWRRTHELVPRRPDGRPNRPWTAFTVLTEPA